MKKQMMEIVAGLLLLAILVYGIPVSKAQAQNTLPEGFVVWAGSLSEAIALCGPVPTKPIYSVQSNQYYNPTQKSYPKAETYRDIDYVNLTCMWTGNASAWKWKYMPEGSTYGFKDGKLISYEGVTLDGQKMYNDCHNRVKVVLYQPEPDKPEPTPTPTPVSTPTPVATPVPTPVPTPTPVAKCTPVQSAPLIDKSSKKGFDPREAINNQPGLSDEHKAQILSRLGIDERTKKVNELVAYFDGCVYNVYVKKYGDSWGWLKWVIAAVIAAAIIGVTWYILTRDGKTEARKVTAVGGVTPPRRGFGWAAPPLITPRVGVALRGKPLMRRQSPDV